VNDFPVVNAFQPTYGGALTNAFVAKLNATGAALLYSSYMGGGGSNLRDAGASIQVDGDGFAYLAGRTETVPDTITGNRFPIANAFQAEPGGGVTDAFVTKLEPGGGVVFSSYLGASDSDGANALALDAVGNVYLTGRTASQDFPIRNAYQPDPGGGVSCGLGLCADGFVTKVAGGGEPPPPGPGTLAIRSGRIAFAGGRPDVFTLRGSIVPDPPVDPANAPAAVEIDGPSGTFFARSLPTGALVRRGAVYLARDPEAARSGGIALLRVARRPNGSLDIALKAFGDLSAATVADLTVELTIGGESYSAAATWRPRANGWSSR
jgi:hypothetical protein